MSRREFGLLLMGTVGIAGCGGSGGRPRAVPVSGVLTFEDRPVVGARLRFVPISDRGRTAIGDTDDAGRFTLATFATGDGILPGEYDVDVTTDMAAPSQPMDTPDLASKIAAERPPEGAVPARYSDVKTSGLHYTIRDEDSGRVVEVKLTK